MTSVSRGTSVRLVDIVTTTVLSGLGAALMIDDVQTVGGHARHDSHSWWMLPVFLAAVVPVLWWRRNLIGVAAWAAAVMALHVFVFGWNVRCGAGLPLAFVLAFLATVRDDWRRAWPALALAELVTVLVLLEDSAAGPGLISVAALITLGAGAIGVAARQRMAMADELRARNEELARLRDANAAVAVNSDRAQLSAELDELLDERLEHLTRAATTPTGGDPARATRLLAGIEADSRRVLDQMRTIVGTLRGGEVALAPAPSVAHLEALLSRHGRGSRLVVAGDPRSLPASVELSAYRVVEHVLGVLDDEPGAGIDVAMRFSATALEITVSGPVHRGADVRAAVARARERVRLQQGTLSVKVTRGRARVLANLPVQPA